MRMSEENPEQGVCWRLLGEIPLPILTLARHALELVKVCESPIEVQLGAELRTAFDLYGVKLALVPQYAFKRYRMDFAILFPGSDRALLFVECDGAEFHSTAEQLANDHAKDSAAELQGIPILRFSGSEIFRHPRACAEIILRKILSICAKSEAA
jgi:very-short-patch-repair endonuclease